MAAIQKRWRYTLDKPQESFLTHYTVDVVFANDAKTDSILLTDATASVQQGKPATFATCGLWVTKCQLFSAFVGCGCRLSE